MDEQEFFFVSAEEEGLRIDRLLAARFSKYSRTYFQYLLDIGCVLLNGEPVKKRIAPEEGDEIEVCFQATSEASLEPEPMDFEILYEDEYILAINKPKGLVVHPAPGNWSQTFVNGLLAHCKNLAPGSDPLRPGIVHRLDKDTTGVLIAAKTLPAHQKLIEMFSSQEIDKLYLAICQGKPPNRMIDMPIGRHPVHRKEMAILPDGRKAVTEIQVAASNDRFSLVLAKPKTGRTHQIRVHLKHIGCPIVGDPVYGKADLHARPLLHAYRLNLIHPITSLPLQLVAPIPQDMKDWLKKLCGPSMCEPVLAKKS